MIWFPPGRAIAQVSTESGPGGEGGRVLKGGRGMLPQSWGPNSPTPPAPLHFMKHPSSPWNRRFTRPCRGGPLEEGGGPGALWCRRRGGQAHTEIS